MPYLGRAMDPLQLEVKNYTFLGDCPPTPPLKTNINTFFSLSANCSLSGWAGGQFSRNVF